MAQTPDPGSVVLPAPQSNDGVDPGSVVLPNGHRPSPAVPAAPRLDMRSFNARQSNLNRALSGPTKGVGALFDTLGSLQRVNASRVSKAASNPRGVLRSIMFPMDPTAILDPAVRTQLGHDVQALIHPDEPGLEDAATAALMGKTPQDFAKLPAVARGASTFAQEMVTDPLTYLGGTGILRKAFEEAGLHIVPAAMRTAARAGQRTQGSSLGDAFQMASEAASWLHDVMTPGGKPIAHAIRELARKQGAQGMAQAERMTSAASGSRSVAAHVGAVGKQLLDQTLHRVPPAAQSAIFKAIHTGSIGSLPEALRPVADRLVQIDRSIPWLLGTKSVRTWLQKRGFILPHEFQVFDQGPRGVLKVSDVREHHVPLPHEMNDAEREAAFRSLHREPGTRAQTDTTSPFFSRRTAEPPPNAFDDASAIRDAWSRSFSAAGRAIGGADLRSSLVRIFGQSPREGASFLMRLGKRMRSGDLARTPLKIDDLVKMTGQEGELVPDTNIARLASRRVRPAPSTAATVLRRRVPQAVRAAYGRQPSKELSEPQELLRWAEKLGNIGKSTLFTTPFPHQRNIATLLALANPTTFPAALANYARMGFGFAKPATKARVLGGAMRAGATGLPNVEQRGLTDLLQRFGPLGKAASKWYGGVGEMLWGWDDAVKKALYDKELRHFNGDAGRAAASVRRKLVDYSLTSPFQEMMRLVAPFATYRTSMPAAVLRSIAEHPEYALGLQRATGGTISGTPFKIDGKPYKVSGPLADVNELLGPGYGKYVRSSTSLTSKALADLFALALRQKEMPFSDKELESNVPIWSMIRNPYGDSLDDRATFNLTGIHPDKEPHARRRRRRYRHPRPLASSE